MEPATNHLAIIDGKPVIVDVLLERFSYLPDSKFVSVTGSDWLAARAVGIDALLQMKPPINTRSN